MINKNNNLKKEVRQCEENNLGLIQIAEKQQNEKLHLLTLIGLGFTIAVVTFVFFYCFQNGIYSIIKHQSITKIIILFSIAMLSGICLMLNALAWNKKSYKWILIAGISGILTTIIGGILTIIGLKMKAKSLNLNDGENLMD